jgi:hypothetical protein
MLPIERIKQTSDLVTVPNITTLELRKGHVAAVDMVEDRGDLHGGFEPFWKADATWSGTQTLIRSSPPKAGWPIDGGVPRQQSPCTHLGRGFLDPFVPYRRASAIEYNGVYKSANIASIQAATVPSNASENSGEFIPGQKDKELRG